MLARHSLFACTWAVLAVVSVECGASNSEMLCDNTSGCDIRLPHHLMQGSSLVGVLQEFQDRLDALRIDVERLYFARRVNIHDFFEKREELSVLHARKAAAEALPLPKPSPSPWNPGGTAQTSTQEEEEVVFTAPQ